MGKAIEEGVALILQGLRDELGLDLEDENFRDTPRRVADAYAEIFQGVSETDAKVREILSRSFPCTYSQMVIAKDVEAFSMCFIGSTFVETPRGRIPINRLSEGDWIYTVDPETFELGLVRCQQPRVTRHSAKLVRVYADNDTVICTPDHMFLTINQGWVEACMLRGGDRVVSLYRSRQNTDHPVLLAHTPNTHSKRLGTGLLRLVGKTTAIPEHIFVLKCTGKDFGAKADRRHYVVHHLDEHPWNNVPENLEGMTISEHNRRHRRFLDIPEDERIRRNLLARKNSHSPEAEAKRSASVRAHWGKVRSDPVLYAKRTKNMGRQYENRRANHVVLGVEPLPWREDVWCLTAPGTETFFANGMAVHNCPHHLLPVHYSISAAYIPTPSGQVLGVSKLCRLVEILARRPVLQEQLMEDITSSLMKLRGCEGAACIGSGIHYCLRMRGVKQSRSVIVTSSLKGAFLDDATARAEFMQLAGGSKR